MQTTLTKGQVSLPIEDEIRTRLKSGQGDTFLLIVPTAQARLKRNRECLEYAPHHAIAGLNVHTLEDLVQRLYRYMSARRQISPGLQMVWLRQIVDEGQFPSLKRNPEIPLPQGTVTRLLGAINQLKMSGVDFSQLHLDLTEPEFSTFNPDKLADLIAIYEDYDDQLGNRWIDRAGIHGTVANRLTGGTDPANQLMRAVYPHVNLVVVEGFDVLSQLDFSILASISDLPEIKMCIVLDLDAQNDSLFGHVKQSYEQFLDFGFHSVNELANHVSHATFHVQHFSQNLFRKTQGLRPSVEKLDLTKQITLLKARDRVKEVEAIAELIKQRVLSTPSLVLEQICVTYYDLERYAPLIREIFPTYGMPYTLDQGGALTNSALATALFSLLDAIGGSGPPPLQSPYFLIENRQSLTADCNFDREMSPNSFRKSFDLLMEISQVRQRILNHGRTALCQAQPSIIEREIGALRCFNSLVNELVEFLILSHGNQQPQPLSAYINWLRLMASQTTYHVQPSTNSGVCVLSLVQTKTLDFDIVILGGLVDGEFPATFRPDAFLPPKQNRTESDRLREDRSLFYQALKLFGEHLYLVVPQRDGDVDLIQSSFIDELKRIADFTIESPKSDLLLSAESFLKRYGTYVWEQSERTAEKSTSPPFQLSDLPSVLRQTLPFIEHNVHVDKSRAVAHNLLQYEGWLSPELLSESSRSELENLRTRRYSVGKLESYGRCPFQYFSNHILLDLEDAEEEDEDGLTSLGKGRRLHEILFEFYNHRRDKPPIAECTDSEFDEAVRELRQIARDVLGVSSRSDLFWEIEMETVIGGGGKRGILPKFLDEERARNFDVKPCHFEVGFGHTYTLDQTDPILSYDEPITVGEVALAGKIDRVEIGDEIFTVGDYKTGASTPKIRDILEGRSLQLPIYLVIVEQLLKKLNYGEAKGVGGIYYILRENSKAELGIGDAEYNGKAFKAGSRSGQLLPNPDQGIESFQSVIDQAVEYANQYVSSIANGEYPLTPHDRKDVCRYCSFKRICRIGAIAEEDAGG